MLRLSRRVLVSSLHIFQELSCCKNVMCQILKMFTESVTIHKYNKLYHLTLSLFLNTFCCCCWICFSGVWTGAFTNFYISKKKCLKKTLKKYTYIFSLARQRAFPYESRSCAYSYCELWIVPSCNEPGNFQPIIFLASRTQTQTPVQTFPGITRPPMWLWKKASGKLSRFGRWLNLPVLSSCLWTSSQGLGG